MNNLFGIDSGTTKVIYMSFCFLVLYSASQTFLNMEKTVISSINDDNEYFEVDGYNILALDYIIYGVSLWLGPSAINIIGLRTCMTAGALIYTLFFSSVLVEKAWVMYAFTAIGGTGASLLWAAEGKYLASNSSAEVISRNVGIFWTFYCSSSIIGNLYSFYILQGKKYLDRGSRNLITYSLTAIGGVATLFFALLPPAEKNETEDKKLQKVSPLKELKTTWKVFKTKEMIILAVTFCYTGLHQAFCSGIYSPSIGFTLQFGNRSKQLVPLSGVFLGLGQVIGSCWQIMQGKRLSKLRWGRRMVLTTGIVAQLISFALIYINIPPSAVFGNTTESAIIRSNIFIAIFCSVLLGFGDGCLNTQNYSILAILFPNEAAQSCALYSFSKSVSVAVGFFLATFFNLYYQIPFLAVMAIFALISYIYADMCTFKKCNDQNNISTP
ncbi:UNC93-like protein MFSD11 isoform X1 [Lycorma delicatula]|uniref:UNC93-like protein MFSD11 isoform X1 n=1 Tax=Lycorma delicatula TaxID=130591 RepID=UPI003F513CA5